MHDHDNIVEVPLQSILHRTAKPDQCTEEEQLLLNQHITKYFIPDKLPVTPFKKQPKRKKAASSTLQPFMAGITENYREESATWAELVFNDLDKESLTVHQLLTTTAFHKDPYKKLRMKHLQNTTTTNCTAAQQTQTTQSTRSNNRSQKNTQLNQSTQETTFWSWQRPRFFFKADEAQQGDGEGCVDGHRSRQGDRGYLRVLTRA